MRKLWAAVVSKSERYEKSNNRICHFVDPFRQGRKENEWKRAFRGRGHVSVVGRPEDICD